MLHFDYLEQLVAFADLGTLSEAAKALHISQPTLTRNMKRLEEELSIPLFKRYKNKLILTEQGDYTVKKARQLLADSQDFLTSIQRFSLQATKLVGGICAPAAEWELLKHLDQSKLQVTLEPLDRLRKGLLDETYQFIVTDKTISQDNILSVPFFEEQLYLSVPKTHPLALKEKLTLEDLRHMTLLLRSDLGVWQNVVDSLSDTKCIVQKDWKTYQDLIEASALPSFSTNITQAYLKDEKQSVHIPISDKEATKTFYVCVLSKHKAILEMIIPNKK
ncbi:LysR family transcriptional regulator [Streptococcus sp. zg-JUN1979]|uniref:LysR family transcriptional regulator n=1 Tax=Streptococcus sp. zg-JUN1979 TaxID=3391450 RepID=UPI0039A49BC5